MMCFIFWQLEHRCECGRLLIASFLCTDPPHIPFVMWLQQKKKHERLVLHSLKSLGRPGDESRFGHDTLVPVEVSGIHRGLAHFFSRSWWKCKSGKGMGHVDPTGQSPLAVVTARCVLEDHHIVMEHSRTLMLSKIDGCTLDTDPTTPCI